MFWNLLALAVLSAATGICVITWTLRLAGVEDGTPIRMPPPEAPLDRVWHEQPVQTFVLQVQVARYWQPPFRRR
jgi:hypothetical protein